ncbi:hypothetical protein RB195_025157 [Necator americanus]|uniref:Uncharacterized protein n=1 Tax=Necator americanus TaxID=51031 RepID=A0ABR1ER37_NECAM
MLAIWRKSDVSHTSVHTNRHHLCPTVRADDSEKAGATSPTSDEDNRNSRSENCAMLLLSPLPKTQMKRQNLSRRLYYSSSGHTDD